VLSLLWLCPYVKKSSPVHCTTYLPPACSPCREKDANGVDKLGELARRLPRRALLSAICPGAGATKAEAAPTRRPMPRSALALAIFLSKKGGTPAGEPCVGGRQSR